MTKQSHRQMPSCLSRLVEGDDKEAYEQYWKDGSTKAIRKLLIEELSARIEQAIVSSEKKDKYDLVNWTQFQADNLGYRRALRELKNILDD